MAKQLEAQKRSRGGASRTAARRPAARKVKPRPHGDHAATPTLIVPDGARAMEFDVKGLGAREAMRMPGPGGRIRHVRVSDAVVTVGEGSPERPRHRCPRSAGARTGSHSVGVPTVDAAFQRGVEAGAQVVQPVQDVFWGDRVGTVEAPAGRHRTLATHPEDLTPREIGRRARAATAGSAR